MMIRAFIAAVCLAFVMACAPMGGLPASPSAVANTTVKDEQGILAVELAYKGVRLALETGVDAGLIHGARATQIKKLDNKAYAAVLAARGAYNTANASSYGAAVTEARSAVAALFAAVKGDTP